MRKNRRGFNHLTGGVNNGHFHAGAKPRVQTDHRPRTGRRSEQQILEIRPEHPDGFGLCRLTNAAEQTGLEVRQELDSPAPAKHLGKPAIGCAGATNHRTQPGQSPEPDDRRMRDHGFKRWFQTKAQRKNGLLTPSKQRQRPM